MASLRGVLGGWIIASVLWASVDCGTDAVGTDACRRIEQARCRKAPACPNLGVTHVEACVQFARDRCLHGLPGPEPLTARLDQCVGAIEQATTCSVVETPEADPACSFLLSASAGSPDASGAASALDGSDAFGPTEPVDSSDAGARGEATDAPSATGVDRAAEMDHVEVESAALDDVSNEG